MIHSQIPSKCSIELRNVSLIYDLYYDKTNTLKEWVVNRLHQRKFVDTKKAKHFALKDVHLKFEEGEKIGIIGLNGSGKSTLLKVISGILKPSLGSLSVTGKVQPLIEIGAGFNPEFSGRENIYLNGYMLGFKPAEIRQKEKEIIEFTELGHFIDLPIKYYSSGMAVRLAFTIATMIRPEILVFDEMLSAGDASFIQKAKQRMQSLLSEAKMLILVSHDLNLIQSLANRVIVMNKGQIAYDGEATHAIRYYLDQIAASVGAEERQANPQLAAQIQKEEILIRSVGSSQPPSDLPTLSVYPGETVVFNLRFAINTDFDEVLVNLEVKDNSGVVACHLRNDFSDVYFRHLKKGEYEVEISVLDVPWKSGEYTYHFRVVGKTASLQKACDSKLSSLVVLGDQSKHRGLKNEWKLNYAVPCLT